MYQEAQQTAEKLFEQKTGGDLSALPVVEVSAHELQEGVEFSALLILAGLASSKGEAKRLIRGGGAKINDQIVNDEFYIITPEDSQEIGIKLSAGKKRHALVKVE